MNIEQISAELEEDFYWRREELAVLKNNAINETKLERRRAFLRSLVVMLYAHFEGYCRHALTVYANAINAQGLKHSEVTYPIVASCMSRSLRSMFNTESPKGPRFEYERAVQFVSSLHEVQSNRVQLPVEDVVNTQANLKPEVLKKILAQLGFSENLLAHHDAEIKNLVSRRAPIAHGHRSEGVSSKEQYEILEKQVFLVMSDLTSAILTAAAQGQFLRTPAAAST